MTQKCVTDEQYGQLRRRVDELVRRTDEGTLLFDVVMAALQNVIRGKFGNAAVSALLDSLGTVQVSSTGKFLANQHFTTNSKEVKITAIGDNFKENFLCKVEDPQRKITLRISKLKKNSLDKPILDELGSKYDTTLASIWELLKKQPNVEFGKLLTNGSANIFYVYNVKGVPWAVSVRWHGAGWFVGAISVEDLREWGGGDQVFSCNS